MIKITIAKLIGIHIGAKTHNQDHVILPNNLSTIKTIVSNPRNPIPPDELELLLDIISSFIMVYFNFFNY
jgi:hypothetical protein